jgi:hypothetical protein
MIACYGRLAGAILGISFAFQVACSIEAAAQEAGAGSLNGGVCSSSSAAFDDPLSKTALEWVGRRSVPTSLSIIGHGAASRK